MDRPKKKFSFGWALAAFALLRLARRRRLSDAAAWTEGDGDPASKRGHGSLALASSSGERAARTTVRSARRARRIGTALSFAALFVAGGALSAAAGDALTETTEGAGAFTCTTTTVSDTPSAECASTTSEASTNEETVPTSGSDGSAPPPPTSGSPGEEPNVSDPAQEPNVSDPAQEPNVSDTAPVSDGGGSAPGGGPNPGDGAETGGADTGAAPDPAGSTGGGSGGAPGGSGGTKPAPSVIDNDRPSSVPTALDPEATDGDVAATIWLHRTLPDPTPSAKRLAPSFVRTLRAVSAEHGFKWPLVLAVVRAQGSTGRVPATEQRLVAITERLAHLRASLGVRRAWPLVLAFSGRTSFADRTIALARYNRAVGLRALVIGLAAAKPALISRVLADDRIDIYSGGRDDVRAGRVDVRVLVLLRYLRIAHGSVTVSSLVSGHRLFARPGVVSAHVYGFAVDISALGGVPILGHQNPGGLTERAVRDVLLLPSELQPQQVIALIGLGGASFPLADHDDHLHVGY